MCVTLPTDLRGYLFSVIPLRFPNSRAFSTCRTTMGGGVSVLPPKEAQNDKLRELLSNKKKMTKLFKEIASSGSTSGRINLANDISLTELIGYFAKESRHPALRTFKVDAEICREAFKHVTGKADSKTAQVSKKDFSKLLQTIFLLSHVWKVFAIIDNHIDDRMIFKGEFMRARESLSNLEGIAISSASLTDEVWENEFQKMDKDGNGHVTFSEFCGYVIKNVVKPIDYFNGSSKSLLVGVSSRDLDSLLGPIEGDELAVDNGPEVTPSTDQSGSLTNESTPVLIPTATSTTQEIPVSLDSAVANSAPINTTSVPTESAGVHANAEVAALHTNSPSLP